MQPNPPDDAPRFQKTPDAAKRLGLSPRTLEKHRCFGTGPIYHKLGGRIVYTVADIDDWAAAGIRRSTSDPGPGIATTRRAAAGDRGR